MFKTKLNFDTFYEAVHSLKDIGYNACIMNINPTDLELKVFDDKNYILGSAIFKNVDVYCDLMKYKFYFNFSLLPSIVDSVKGKCDTVKIIIENDIVFDFGKVVFSINLSENKKQLDEGCVKLLKLSDSTYVINKDMMKTFLSKFYWGGNIEFQHNEFGVKFNYSNHIKTCLLTANIAEKVLNTNPEFFGETIFDDSLITNAVLPMCDVSHDIVMGFKRKYPLIAYFETPEVFVLTAVAPRDADE